MLNGFIGALLGFLSGLGVGGGSLLLLWLMIVQGIPHAQARLMNLMFFLPCALVACAFRWKQIQLPWRIILPAIAAAIAGVWLGNYLRSVLDTQLLKKIFGILFVLCGIRELMYREA